jgi:DNA primase
MFPLTTYAGKIVGFSGRVMDPAAKEAKYINSPETELYHKSELLFGITQAKRTIKDRDRIVIVEGELDVISSHQIGLNEVVAIKGSALTEEQASLIRRLTGNVILSMDADAAGQEAIKRGIAVCETKALNLRVVRIAGGKDPDELARTDPAAWKQMVKSAESVYSFLIHHAVSQYDPDTGEGKKQITQTVIPDLAKIEHAVEREYYVKKLSESIKVSDQVINEELIKYKRTGNLGSKKETILTEPESFSRRERIERQLLCLILQAQNPQELSREISLEWFEEPHLKRLVEAIQNTTALGKNILTSLPETVRELATDVFSENISWLELSREDVERLRTKTINELKLVWAKQRLTEITKTLAEIGDNPDQTQTLQAEYRAMSQLIRETTSRP